MFGGLTTGAVGRAVGSEGIKLSHLSYYKAIKQQYLQGSYYSSNDDLITLASEIGSSDS